MSTTHENRSGTASRNTSLRAMCTFAGNTATNNAISPHADTRRVRRTNIPSPNTTSATPDTYTNSRGRGNDGGTARSNPRGHRKCATPATT